MIQTIVSTVGTSLLSNVKEGNPKLCPLYKSSRWTEFGTELSKLDPKDRLCGAEINSLCHLLSREDTREVSRLHFCLSDTEQGHNLGKILKAYYKITYPDLRITQEQIPDLSDSVPQRFRVYGLRNLARHLGALVRQSGDPRYIVLNCTGGYKAQVAIAVLIGQTLGVDVYYKHELFQEIISFPSMPVAFDHAILEEHGSLLTHLESGTEFEAPEQEVERIRPLLEEIEVDGRRLWALAPIGQIFLDGYRKKYPADRTVPPPVPSEERKEPTFGNNHHYPKGFKEFVKRVWLETPYIQTCRTVPYAGQAGIVNTRFYVAPDQSIVGEYRDRNNFGARFEVVANGSNSATRIAIVMDLAARFGGN